mmetsp:Transcript_24411/g.70060  ORF Transcript_24411/g.70060 Transcript_24411/m.70060 type:complete len:216 (+) Transcript_24411:192-839(+)
MVPRLGEVFRLHEVGAEAAARHRLLRLRGALDGGELQEGVAQARHIGAVAEKGALASCHGAGRREERRLRRGPRWHEGHGEVGHSHLRGGLRYRDERVRRDCAGAIEPLILQGQGAAAALRRARRQRVLRRTAGSAAEAAGPGDLHGHDRSELLALETDVCADLLIASVVREIFHRDNVLEVDDFGRNHTCAELLLLVDQAEFDDLLRLLHAQLL